MEKDLHNETKKSIAITLNGIFYAENSKIFGILFAYKKALLLTHEKS